MLSKIKKEIKSPFSQANSIFSSSYQEKNIKNKDNGILKEKIFEYNLSSAFIKTSYSTIPKSSYLKKQIKNIPLGLNILLFLIMFHLLQFLLSIMANKMNYLVVKIKNVSLFGILSLNLYQKTNGSVIYVKRLIEYYLIIICQKMKEGIY